MQTDFRNHDDGAWPTDEERRARAQQALWSTLGILYRWRRFIIGVTGVVAVLAVVISLLLPNWYSAGTRLLLPTSSGSGLLAAGLLDDLPSSAKSLLGGGGADYYRYLSILSSRSVYERVVEEFSLTDVYEVADSPTAKDDAIEILAENSDFAIDEDYEYLTVYATDKDPQRAADMANFFVAELEKRNAELAAKGATNYRQYIEKRYEETTAQLDSVLSAVRGFQEEYGILNPEIQGERYFEYMADLRANAVQAETQYEVLLSQYGPENSAVKVAREGALAANRKVQEALLGREELMPVSKGEMPRVALEYVYLEGEAQMLAKLLEYIRPALEEARFNEERQLEAVQVVDVAVPPVRKSKPKRSVICIAATLSAFLLAVLFALVYTWWQRHHAEFARRLHLAADEAAPPASPSASGPSRSPAKEPPVSRPVAP